MRFEDSFQVPVPLPEAWDALTDIERVYPCLPGAQLVEVTDNEFHGLVSLKLGPISASYKGVARFDSLDRENARLVIQAEGRDRHGQGTAKALVTAVLTPEGDHSTRVAMINEINITGKAAQFGRGVLTDVSKAMMAQFAHNLSAAVTSPPAAQNGQNGHSERPAHDVPPAPAPAPVDAISVARGVLSARFEASPVRTALALVAPLALLVFIRRAIRAR